VDGQLGVRAFPAEEELTASRAKAWSIFDQLDLLEYWEDALHLGDLLEMASKEIACLQDMVKK
jgi:hypothetical protein